MNGFFGHMELSSRLRCLGTYGKRARVLLAFLEASSFRGFCKDLQTGCSGG